MSNSDDSEAAADAQKLLENLSSSDQNIVLMAKANYFKHLIQRLSTGPEDVNMIMVSTLADMELTDHNKASLFEGGVLGLLLHLVANGDSEMKKVAIKALRNLSSLPAKGLQMIKEGAVRPLLDLLFWHISSSTGLHEQVAATMMHLAESTVSQESSSTPLSLLESDDDTLMLFSLINLTGPEVQHNILRIFYALCQSPSASTINTKLTEISAMQVLAHLCEHNNQNVRANAVKLFCCLVEDGDEAIITEHVDQNCLNNLLKIIRSSDDMEEIASAMGIISNLQENPQITLWLLDAGALQVIVRCIPNSRQNNPHKNQLIENVVGAICRFKVSKKLEWQKRAAEAGIIPLLVQLLDIGSPLTRKNAAVSLTHFSQSSLMLSRPIPKKTGLWCFSAPPKTGCRVHGSICAVESSFCLLEADAIIPLVKVLEDPDPGFCEAALEALLTLIEAERLQSGIKVLAEANAIPSIIKFLGSSSPSLQEKTLKALERISCCQSSN